eukprot:CAMPEP_0119268402 /NCGR_PEP_ID=MMETSP1329-20130426/6199_1 /TAXON_ID=114041 /ORGANISM="Genus nov. species nov., Strain RCC1024" /LENGTH=288 /DNA_ID=CAMNT_0007268375 /DNA_START=153 /DNA_END=1016 /DNA_ORIENTATION=-
MIDLTAESEDSSSQQQAPKNTGMENDGPPNQVATSPSPTITTLDICLRKTFCRGIASDGHVCGIEMKKGTYRMSVAFKDLTHSKNGVSHYHDSFHASIGCFFCMKGRDSPPFSLAPNLIKESIETQLQAQDIVAATHNDTKQSDASSMALTHSATNPAAPHQIPLNRVENTSDDQVVVEIAHVKLTEQCRIAKDVEVYPSTNLDPEKCEAIDLFTVAADAARDKPSVMAVTSIASGSACAFKRLRIYGYSLTVKSAGPGEKYAIVTITCSEQDDMEQAMPGVNIKCNW